LEDDLHEHAEVQVLDRALDGVGGQPDPVVLLDGDLGHDERGGQPREGEAVVDGETDEPRPAGDLPDLRVVRAALAAHRLRRVDQRGAVGAGLEAQSPVTAGGPEELGLLAQLRLWTGGLLLSGAHRTLASAFRTVTGSASPCWSQAS